jgi:uncharacterized protein with HEPN domain
MSGDRERLSVCLMHIRNAISRIERYTTGMDEATFLDDERTQDAVIRNFEIIGEASRNILQRYPEFATEHSHLPLGAA